MRIDRMLAIVVLLLNRDRVSARDLAHKFEISVRTVYRDIEAINLAGIPVVSYPGNQGGFGIVNNYKLDKQLLTFKDMLSILSALKGINSTLEDSELDSAIEKISGLVPDHQTDQLNLHLNQLVIDIMPWGYQQRQKDFIKVVHQSVIHQRVIRFQYRNYEGGFLEREVEPLTLVFKGYAWYLFAYCLVREDFRLFRLSRMRELTVLNETFERKDADYRDYEQVDLSQVKMLKVKLKFDVKVRSRVEDFYEDNQIEVLADGSIVVETEFPESDWFFSYILSFGIYAEILEPESLRTAFAEHLDHLRKIYRKN